MSYITPLLNELKSPTCNFEIVKVLFLHMDTKQTLNRETSAFKKTESFSLSLSDHDIYTIKSNLELIDFELNPRGKALKEYIIDICKEKSKQQEVNTNNNNNANTRNISAEGIKAVINSFYQTIERGSIESKNLFLANSQAVKDYIKNNSFEHNERLLQIVKDQLFCDYSFALYCIFENNTLFTDDQMFERAITHILDVNHVFTYKLTPHINRYITINFQNPDVVTRFNAIQRVINANLPYLIQQIPNFILDWYRFTLINFNLLNILNNMDSEYIAANLQQHINYSPENDSQFKVMTILTIMNSEHADALIQALSTCLIEEKPALNWYFDTAFNSLLIAERIQHIVNSHLSSQNQFGVISQYLTGDANQILAAIERVNFPDIELKNNLIAKFENENNNANNNGFMPSLPPVVAPHNYPAPMEEITSTPVTSQDDSYHDLPFLLLTPQASDLDDFINQLEKEAEKNIQQNNTNSGPQ